MKKSIGLILCLTVFLLLCACGKYNDSDLETAYSTAFQTGKTEGYESGYEKGHTDGLSAGYEDGYDACKAEYAGNGQVIQYTFYEDVIRVGKEKGYFSDDVSDWMIQMVKENPAFAEKVETIAQFSWVEQPDYATAEEFEAALNEGHDLTGKSVSFVVTDIRPNSAFGYNLITGKHLNFCSPKNPGYGIGDTVTVKVTSVTSVLGSYVIYYDLAK